MVTQLGRWAFLTYRLPREPSAPRLAVWRSLRRLGAIQVGDGVVALPHSTRNLERFEWLAAGIGESGGSASVWLAQPTSARMHWAFVEQLQRTADEEYRGVLKEARLVRASGGDVRRAVRRLRARLRRIQRRDYFGAAVGAQARAEVSRLVPTEP